MGKHSHIPNIGSYVHSSVLIKDSHIPISTLVLENVFSHNFLVVWLTCGFVTRTPLCLFKYPKPSTQRKVCFKSQQYMNDVLFRHNALGECCDAIHGLCKQTEVENEPCWEQFAACFWVQQDRRFPMGDGPPWYLDWQCRATLVDQTPASDERGATAACKVNLGLPIVLMA